MPATRKILKVFLASPGDLADERKSAKLVVDEFNSLLADEFGYQVELVGWEDTVSVFGRPQATINKELDRCELFIGILWKHWGTPPSKDGPFESGFEEEYRTTVQRREKTGRPEISLFLKNIAPEFMRDPGDQLKKVLEFRKELIAEKKILFEAFDDARGFEGCIRRLITSYVRRLVAEEQVEGQRAASSDQEHKREQPEPAAAEIQSEATGAIARESGEFLRDLLEAKDALHKPISPVDVARLRLISFTAETSANDDVELGTHDANLLYLDPASAGYSYREKSHLLSCGLHHYQSENAPVWKWYVAIDGFNTKILPIYTGAGTESAKIGAFGAMREIGASIDDVPMFSRPDFLAMWFEPDVPVAVRNAALGYLADQGKAEDADVIQEELSRNDGATSSAAVEALTNIALRDSRSRAVSTLIELQPTTVSQQLVQRVFADATTLPDELIEACLRHSSALIRYYVLNNAVEGSAPSDETLEALLGDRSSAVRAEALRQLTRRGRIFTLEEATTIVKPETEPKGLLRSTESKLAETAWHEYQQERLARLAIAELEASPGLSFFQADAFFALVERQFAKRKQALKELIRSRFSETYEEEIRRVSAVSGANSELERQIASLSEFIRRRLTRCGLNVLCRKGGRPDLSLVRDTLRANYVDYSTADADFLGRFGEFSDISLLMQVVERPATGPDGTIVWDRDSAKFDGAAKAIVRLAGDRAEEILSQSTKPELLARIIIQLSDKTFKALPDTLLLQLFSAEADDVRKAAAVRCIKTLPKKRSEGLLASYTAPERHRFYNVVRWLDLAVSAPRELAVEAASRTISRHWSSP